VTPDSKLLQRIRFLARVVRRECGHLQATDSRLFEHVFTSKRVRELEKNSLEAERVEAFVGRFGRLQDNLGEKLLPCYLEAVGEPVGVMLDNLDLAERLNLMPSADRWFAIRRVRNQMVHEYIEDPEILSSALQSGHEFVPVLLQTADGLQSAIQERGWLD
jgi:hypothetical protein